MRLTALKTQTLVIRYIYIYLSVHSTFSLNHCLSSVCSLLPILTFYIYRPVADMNCSLNAAEKARSRFYTVENDAGILWIIYNKIAN